MCDSRRGRQTCHHNSHSSCRWRGDNYSNHFRKLGALGSAVTVHSGDNGRWHLCNAIDEEQTPRKTARFCGLRRFPHSGLRAPVPDVAGGEPHVEQFLLNVGAGVLEQRSEVPEHAHIGQLIPVASVDLEDGTQDPQVESLGVRMTSWGRPPVSDPIQSHFTARIATPASSTSRASLQQQLESARS